MSDATGRDEQNLDGLIRDLVADLDPVTRLPSPWTRATVWLAVVAGLALGLSFIADLPAVQHRLMAAPDMWLAVVGSALTAILATTAAFQLGVPDRGLGWAFLPVPGLALWLGASGMGCARTWLIPGTHDASLSEAKHCLAFIVGVSVPLSLLLFTMLRRGYSLYPTMTGVLAGLAAAAAAATLLTLFHPFDAAATDLIIHGGAVALVVGANQLLGGMILSGRRARPEPLR